MAISPNPKSFNSTVFDPQSLKERYKDSEKFYVTDTGYLIPKPNQNWAKQSTHHTKKGIPSSGMNKLILGAAAIIVLPVIFKLGADFFEQMEPSKDRFFNKLLSQEELILKCASRYTLNNEFIQKSSFGIESCLERANYAVVQSFKSCLGEESLQGAYKMIKRNLVKLHPDKNDKVTSQDFSQISSIMEFIRNNKKTNFGKLRRECDNEKDLLADESVKEWAKNRFKKYRIKNLHVSTKKWAFKRCPVPEFRISFPFEDENFLMQSKINGQFYCITKIGEFPSRF